MSDSPGTESRGQTGPECKWGVSGWNRSLPRLTLSPWASAAFKKGVLEGGKAAEIQSWNIHTGSCFTTLLVLKMGPQRVKTEADGDGAPNFPIKRDDCVWGRWARLSVSSRFRKSSWKIRSVLGEKDFKEREREREKLRCGEHHREHHHHTDNTNF